MSRSDNDTILQGDTMLEERPCTSHEACLQHDKKLREALNERQLDKMLKDSFPASDPPSTY